MYVCIREFITREFLQPKQLLLPRCIPCSAVIKLSVSVSVITLYDQYVYRWLTNVYTSLQSPAVAYDCIVNGFLW